MIFCSHLFHVFHCFDHVKVSAGSSKSNVILLIIWLMPQMQKKKKHLLMHNSDVWYHFQWTKEWWRRKSRKCLTFQQNLQLNVFWTLFFYFWKSTGIKKLSYKILYKIYTDFCSKVDNCVQFAFKYPPFPSFCCLRECLQIFTSDNCIDLMHL